MPRGLPGGMGSFGIDRYITLKPVCVRGRKLLTTSCWEFDENGKPQNSSLTSDGEDEQACPLQLTREAESRTEFDGAAHLRRCLQSA